MCLLRYLCDKNSSDLIGYLKLEKRPVKKDSVYYTEEIEEGNAVFDENIDGIKRALDFEKLRIMLGK